MKIRRKYAPLYNDASILLRPKTGLKDMYLELDPGNREARASWPRVEPVPLARHAARREPGRVPGVAGRRHARLPAGAAERRRRGLRGRRPGRAAPDASSASSPPARDIAQDHASCSSAPAQHPRARSTTSRSWPRSWAERTASCRRARRLGQRQLRGDRRAGRRTCARRCGCCPARSTRPRDTLTDVDALAGHLGPALSKLRPGARALGPSLRETRPFLRTTTPVIRDQIRPFARDVQPTVRDLRTAAKDLAVVTPRLTHTFGCSTRWSTRWPTTRAAARRATCSGPRWAQPHRARLFGHQDAHGPVRRGLVLICAAPALGVLEQHDPPRRRAASWTSSTRLLNAPTPGPGLPPGRRIRGTPLADGQGKPPASARWSAMIAFALSCVAILLYLWLTFGGSVPLRAEGYRFDGRSSPRPPSWPRRPTCGSRA